MLGEEAVDYDTTTILAAMVTLGPRPTEDYDVEADQLADALEDLYDEDSPEYEAVMENARWDPLFMSRITPVLFGYLEMVRSYEVFREWSDDDQREALETDATLRASLHGARMVDHAEGGREVGLYAHAWHVCYHFLMNHNDGARMVLESVFALDDDDAPDDAPPCDHTGCDRLGVIPQVVTTPEGSRTWHWCLTHGPEED